MSNLLEGLQQQIDRCVELKKIYLSIPTGIFGATFIQNAIDRGKKALVSGDIIEQLSAYKELEGCE
jgi:hypothetical protein